MTENREFYASTIEEAVEKAATELGLPSEDVSYRVLDEGNTGFLGIGARDARITVEASPENAAVSETEPLEADSAESDAVDVPEPEPSENVAAADSSTLAEVYGESSESEQVRAPDELLEEVRVLVSSVLDAMGFEARVEVYDAGGFIAADVAPDNTALFIGQKGETI